MPKHIRYILLLIAVAPGLEAREPDLSLSNSQFDGQAPVDKQHAEPSTWFGIGYESRREQTDRANFEDSAMRNSVFSSNGGSSPLSPAGMNGGGGGAGGRR